MRVNITTLDRCRQSQALVSVVALLAIAPASASAGVSVLHDQYDGVPVPEIGTSSYGTIQSSERAADDFVVPAGQRWTIRGVDVRGQFTTDAPATASQYFGVVVAQAGANGKPGGSLGGALVRASYGEDVRDIALRDLQFRGVELTLDPGRYWLTVLSSTEPGNLESAATTPRPWRWTNRTRLTGLPAVWKSDGVHGPASAPVSAACYRLWGFRASECHLDPSNPDQVFRIRGTATIVS